jgi:hypothetical protein
MKKLVALLNVILLMAIQYASAQEWIRYYGQGENAVCRYISSTHDNGVVIGGTINLYKYLWIIKTDVNGNIIWNKKIGNGLGDCTLRNIEQTDDGGFILCGSWTMVNPTRDAFIMKLNSCAEIEWCKVLDTPDNYDLGIRIKETLEGDFLLMGAYFETNPPSNTSLFKFDALGNLLWHQFYPLDSIYYQDLPYDMYVENDSYLILTDRYYPDPDTVSPATIRHHFTKTDTSGLVLWDLIYGIEEDYYGSPWCLKESSSGAFYEAGRHLHQDMTSSPAIVKLTSDGIPLYDADILTNIFFGGLCSIDILHDSLLVMSGRYYPDDQNTSYDAFFKTDTLGSLKKTKIIQYTSTGYWSACKTIDSKFIAVGNDFYNGSWRIVAVKVNSDLEYDTLYTQPFTYDSLCPYQIVSETINPDCDNVIVKVDEPFRDPLSIQLKIYPNPTDKIITIELPRYLVINSHGNSAVTTIHHRWSGATLQAIDLRGNIILQKQVSDNSSAIQLDVSALAAGIYQFTLIYQGKQVAGSKVVVK